MLEDSRHEEVLHWRKAGLTYAEIGRKLDLTRERIRQIINGNHKTNKKPASESPDDLLTAAQAARLLNVHVNTIRHWSSRGILETYRIGPRGDRRFRRRDIDNLLLKESSISSGKFS